jgi:galactose-1-phosphate uridylyltransferase
MRARAKSKIEIYIQGGQIVVYEHYSRGFQEQILEKARTEYGIEFQRKGHSMWCG